MPNIKLSKDYRGGRINKSIFSSVNNDQFSMTIDPNSMQHIINRLTDLYKDPIVATVREIISNAIDATRGIPEDKRKPIDIGIPSAINGEFSVTDHALGLSLDEIKNIYTRYGSSTKRSDFSQIGAYGLGSKAPLSYTTEFNVTTAKDGYLTEILISIEEGSNTVKIISHEKTDKENFMKVLIPVRREDVDAFQDALVTYVKHPMKDVQFNGLNGLELNDKNPDKFFTKMNYGGMSLNLYLSDFPKVISRVGNLMDAVYKNNIVFDILGVLSGFEYELGSSEDESRNYYYNYNTIKIAVDLVPGLVDFSSSRDEITNTPRKTKLVDSILNVLNENKNKLLTQIYNVMPHTDDNIRDLFAYLQVNSSDFVQDENLQFMFVLSNGESLNDTQLRPLAFIDNQGSIPEYGKRYSWSHPAAPVSLLNKHIRYFFNRELANKAAKEALHKQKLAYSVSQDTPEPNLTEAEVKDENSAYLSDLIVSHIVNLTVITDISDSKQGEKVLRGRNVTENSTYLFCLFTEPLDKVKKVIDKYFVNSSINIKYESVDDYLAKVRKIRKQKAKKPVNIDRRELNPSATIYTSDPNSFVEAASDYFYSSSFDYHSDKKSALTIGLIGRKLNDYSSLVPYILKFTGKQLTINIYEPESLRLYDWETLQDDNDYLFISEISSEHIKSVNLQKKLLNANLDKIDTVDLSKVKLSPKIEKILRGIGLLNYISKTFTKSDEYEYAIDSAQSLFRRLPYVTDSFKTDSSFMDNVLTRFVKSFKSVNIIDDYNSDRDKKLCELIDKAYNSHDTSNESVSMIHNDFVEYVANEYFKEII